MKIFTIALYNRYSQKSFTQSRKGAKSADAQISTA